MTKLLLHYTCSIIQLPFILFSFSAASQSCVQFVQLYSLSKLMQPPSQDSKLAHQYDPVPHRFIPPFSQQCHLTRNVTYLFAISTVWAFFFFNDLNARFFLMIYCCDKTLTKDNLLSNDVFGLHSPVVVH